MSAQSTVCSLSLVLRVRLACGIYCARAVRPCLRPLARAYCVALPLTFGIIIYRFQSNSLPLTWLFWMFSCVQYFLHVIVSFCTGDEYIYNYFTRNHLTDTTIDSPMIFNRLQRVMKKHYIGTAMFQCGVIAVLAMIWHRIGIVNFILYVVPLPIFDFILTCSCSAKLLVMRLFNSRLLVLRRRLERHGFRRIGRVMPQPYCQIYGEIIRGLDATNNPLKALVFFDLIFVCGRAIISMAAFLEGEQDNYEFVVLIKLLSLATIINYIYLGFSYVIMIESAAMHTKDMIVFTVSQLIKAPTAEERLRMREFLGVLATRSAHYGVLRALPIDARLVLQALTFCFSQVISFYKVINEYNRVSR